MKSKELKGGAVIKRISSNNKHFTVHQDHVKKNGGVYTLVKDSNGNINELLRSSVLSNYISVKV